MVVRSASAVNKLDACGAVLGPRGERARPRAQELRSVIGPRRQQVMRRAQTLKNKANDCRSGVFMQLYGVYQAAAFAS